MRERNYIHDLGFPNESNIDHFKKQILNDSFYKSYTTKVILGRKSALENSWNAIFLILILNKEKYSDSRILFDSPSVKIIEETSEIESVDEFIGKFFQSKDFPMTIGGSEFKVDLISFPPNLSFIQKETWRQITGFEYPGNMLSVRGGWGYDFSSLKDHLDNSLLMHDPPYESLEDLINSIIKVNIRQEDFTRNRHPYLAIFFAPKFIRLEQPYIDTENNKLLFKV